ncbi:unnamed protein product [Brachionus calyciflorus]|uniref:HNH endonuclease n=1 Tax=Brachionus calyciflorus TaxID=104777 RepID=A0A814K2P6_9BILA|nr:unnamed protein product [Brachionus calyciflorus]
MSYRKRKDEIWEKGDTIPNMDPNKYRQDKSGNVIYYDSFGKFSKMGWNIDHSKPQSLGGSDHLNNLYPMQSAQNSSKGNTYRYNYSTAGNLGLTRYDIIDTEIDKRSSLVRNEEVLFNYDGTVDSRSAAVRNGTIRLNNDGSINKNSIGVRSGNLIFK